MTLPDVCPRDGVSQCKKAACHLYVIEWRTGDEQCVIGYRSTHKQLSRSVPVEDNYAERTHKQLSKSVPVEDNYAERTRIRLGRDVRQEKETRHEPVSDTLERKHLEKPASRTKEPEEAYMPSVRHEEVVVNNKDTTVFESRHIEEKKSKDNRKRTSVDKMMDMDLPENYEEEFWK